MICSKWMGMTGLALSLAASAGAQTVRFDGREVRYGDPRPYNRGREVMVPIQQTVDRLGLSCRRDGDRFFIEFSMNKLEYRKGDRTFRLNGHTEALEYGSEDRGRQTFVPARLFGELTRGRLKADQRDNDRPGWGGNNGNRPGWGGQGGNWQSQNLRFNGRELSFSDRERPYRSQGTLLVPFRALGEKIGARTDRTEDGKRVFIYYNGDRVQYDKGRWYRLNSDRKWISASAEERDGVLFVPVALYTDITRDRLIWRR